MGIEQIEIDKYYERATKLTVTKIVDGQIVSMNTYNILEAIPGTEFKAISSLSFRQLTEGMWINRLAAFRAYVASEEGVASIVPFETNLFRRENALCGPQAPDPPDEDNYTIQVQVDWLGDDGSLSGIGGSINLLDDVNVEQDSYTITQYTKRSNAAFTQPKTNPCKLDLSSIVGYVDGGSAIQVERRWRLAESQSWTSNDITDLYNSDVQIFVEVDTI